MYSLWTIIICNQVSLMQHFVGYKGKQYVHYHFLVIK